MYIRTGVDKHAVFRREGNDIHLDAPITVSKAILGGDMRVPTLEGEVDLRVPAGAQPGEKRVLRNKGVPNANSKSRGNLYVHFNVLIPTSLSAEQERLIKEYAQLEESALRNDQSWLGSKWKNFIDYLKK